MKKIFVQIRRKCMKRMTGFTALLACATLHFVLAACSNSSGDSGTPAGTAQTGTPASGAYKKIGVQTINGTQYDIVTFGLWPQTIKAANVEVNDQVETMNMQVTSL